MDKSTAIFNADRIQIIDWRNMSFSDRFKIMLRIVIHGYVDIEWKKNNIVLITDEK